jgi:type VI secretion system protein ImpH
MLSGVLGRPVRIESFAGRWMRLVPQERTRLARAPAARRRSSAQLGASAVLGGTVFDRQHHFRIHVGPLDAAGLQALLPRGPQLAAVQALVAQHVGLEFGWDVEVELADGEAPAVRLGRGARLGWTSWLGAPPPGSRPRLRLQPREPGAAAPHRPAGAPAPAPAFSLV